MKTYTLEELKLAQAKKCRIETVTTEGVWRTVEKPLLLEFLFEVTPEYCRIHPADEWKARLPRLREGAEWACVMTERVDGFRPLVVGELVGDGPEGSPALKGYGFLTNRPVPPEFLHPDELAKQPEAAPQTDTPDTNEEAALMTLDCDDSCVEIYIKRYDIVMDGDFVLGDFARTLERRAIAAEAKLAKWESELSKVMPQDFKDWWQNSRDEWPEVASMVIEGLRKQVEMTDKAAEARVKELESKIADLERRNYDTNRRLSDALVKLVQSTAALRLRPISEAGSVPEGAERLWASYIDEMQTWSVYPALIDPSEFDTHFIDIYPPQQ